MPPMNVTILTRFSHPQGALLKLASIRDRVPARSLQIEVLGDGPLAGFNGHFHG